MEELIHVLYIRTEVDRDGRKNVGGPRKPAHWLCPGVALAVSPGRPRRLRRQRVSAVAEPVLRVPQRPLGGPVEPAQEGIPERYHRVRRLFRGRDADVLRPTPVRYVCTRTVNRAEPRFDRIDRSSWFT